VGLVADEYRHGQASDPTWTGVVELEISDEERDRLYAGEALENRAAAELPTHTGLVLRSPNGSALGRVYPDKHVRLVRADREAFGLRGRSAEQRIALDLLLDESVGIVSLGGRAGTGKSALALCAGLEAVMERRRHKKVVVFRPLYPVGGQELGYLPGTESEKMSPWAQAVFDTLGAVVHENVIDEIAARGLLEVLLLTHIRAFADRGDGHRPARRLPGLSGKCGLCRHSSCKVRHIAPGRVSKTPGPWERVTPGSGGTPVHAAGPTARTRHRPPSSAGAVDGRR
jgi:PhoH-like ATPase